MKNQAKRQPASAHATLLLVDDEAYVRESMAELLERRGFDVRAVASGAEALKPCFLDGVDLLITDLKMPGMDGKELVAAAAKREPGLPILVLTAHGTVASAVECLRLGAADYLVKPADPEALFFAIERAIGEARRRRELDYLREVQDPDRDAPLGSSRAWQELMSLAARVAPSDSSVLLMGESGTGKEEVARYLHRRGPRKDQALVVVNCAAIPAELFESELFGHRKGAFTGAVSDREGRFHVAHRGTLVLDEVNSLSLVSQAKLLRVLQDGAFERVGDSRSTQVDVRLICASNADLSAEVEAGRFRADLYYRINVVTLALPPLRDRRDDIGLLAQAFVGHFRQQLDRPVRGLTGRCLSALEAYSWPGNVRELRNVIERGVLLAQSEWLDSGLLPFESGSKSGDFESDAESEADEPASLDLRARLQAVEAQTLVRALERAGGVRREAARLLGVDERNLAYYLRKNDLMGWQAPGDDS